MEQFTLTQNQQQVHDLAENSNDNILVIGKPGVGKSVLIRALTKTGMKRYSLAAPTGLAALNINGKTLHSIFQIPTSSGIIHPTYNRFTILDSVLKNIKYHINHLIIDEISMVRADVFDYIDRLMQYCKGNTLPFGGTQLICFGDFFQLPPVVVGYENQQLKEAGYKSPFVFDAKCFSTFKVVQLHEVLRQKGDTRFLDLLDSARTGQVSPKELVYLNANVAPLDELRIALTGTNKEALAINERKLQALDSHKSYEANCYGSWPAFPTDKILTIAVGAQVLVKKNYADKPPNLKEKFESKVVNGTLGVVVEIEPNCVYIKTELHECVPIYVQSWEQKIKEEIDGEWNERIVASFQQMPLTLAWAISIHKSQGQTFERVYIDAAKIFMAGQMYVALSRAKSKDGITLASRLTQQKFFANKDVLKFNLQINGKEKVNSR